MLVLFPRLFQALLTVDLDMMDDDGDNIVIETPREDFPFLDAIVNVSAKTYKLSVQTWTCLSCGIMWLFSIVYH